MRAVLLISVCGLLLSGCGSTARISLPGTWRGPGVGLSHRIGAVSIGEQKDRVDAVLGPGVSKSPHPLLFFYPRAGLYVRYSRSEPLAGTLITHSSRYRTASGAGVGMSLDQLRQRVKVACEDGGITNGPLTYCHYPLDCWSSYCTDFKIDSQTKRVTEVAIFPPDS